VSGRGLDESTICPGGRSAEGQAAAPLSPRTAEERNVTIVGSKKYGRGFSWGV
jgi:hypothetical protein